MDASSSDKAFLPQTPPEPSASRSVGGTGEELVTVRVAYKGRKEAISVARGCTGAALCGKLEEVFACPPGMLFKLSYKNKKILPDSVVLDMVKPNGVIIAVGTAKAVAAAIADKKSDPLVKGFEQEDEDRRRQQRVNESSRASVWGTGQDKRFKFATFGSLQRFEGQNPHPFAAREMLLTLACDPGIVSVMKTHGLVVGKLTEMDPDDRLAAVESKKRGGCLLGYNENAGSCIFIRLRNPDGGNRFRPYTQLIDTLVHELAHNVAGPHETAFWSTFMTFKVCYLRAHLDRVKRPIKYRHIRKTAPPTETPKSDRELHRSVQQKMSHECTSNGALNPRERQSAGAVAAQLGAMISANAFLPGGEDYGSSSGAQSARAQDEREQLRQLMAQKAAERLAGQQQRQ